MFNSKPIRMRRIPKNEDEEDKDKLIEQEKPEKGEEKEASQELEGNLENNNLTVEEVIQYIGFGKYQYLILSFAGLCWMADAMEIMLLSFLSHALSCTWLLSDTQKASLSTAVFLGMMIGSVSWGRFSDRFGRRLGLVFSNILVLLGGLGSVFAPNYWVMLVLRALVGCGVSGGHISVTLFSEFSPVESRGFWLIVLEVWFTTGCVFEGLLAWATLPNFGNESWRWLLGVSVLPVVIALGVCPFVPESPRWLALNKREPEARKILLKIAEVNGKNIFPKFSEALKIKGIKTKNSIFDLLSPKLRLTSLLLWGIWFVCAFFYYGMVLLVVELFKVEDRGLRCTSGYVSNTTTSTFNTTVETLCEPIPLERYIDIVITSFAELPGLLVTVLTVDRIGRKKTMIAEFAASGVIIFTLFICLPRILQTILMFILRALISGAYQVVYIYTPEVYPTLLRSSGLGMGSSMARIGGMITPFIATVLSQQSGFGLLLALGIYGISSILAAIFSFLLPIETAGRPLRDTLEEFEDYSSVNTENTTMSVEDDKEIEINRVV